MLKPPLPPRRRVTGAGPVRRRAARRVQGVSLLEVLVAILLVSIGMLGMVGLQASSVRAAVGAEDGLRASALASEIASTMWLNRSLTLSADALQAWQDRVADPASGGLPNGQGEVTLSGSEARIAITWRPPQAKATEPDQRYVTQVLIP